MRKTFLIALAIVLLAAGCGLAANTDNALTAKEKTAGWKLLFDGKTLDGWTSTRQPNEGWVVKDGAIELQTPRQGGYLHTTQQYGDFQLKMDFMVDSHANSGVFFRWTNLDDPVQTGIEMQVIDNSITPLSDRQHCGAVYDVMAPSEDAVKPVKQWNTVIITCRKNLITIKMNGKRIINLDLDKYTEPHKNTDGTSNKFDTAYKNMPRKGYIGLQDHGGKVWYKNIEIKQL